MAQYAELPDGTRLEFPDDTSPQVIQSVVKRHLGVATQPEQQTTVQTQPQASAMQEVQASIPGRILQGARDPIDEAAAMLPKGLEAITSLGGNYPNVVSKYFGDEASRVQALNKQNEAEYQTARQASGSQGTDIARFGGNVVSPANLAMALRAGKATTLGGKIAQGAGVGAVGGALSGEADVNSPDYWKEKTSSAAIGAGIGGAIPVVAGGISRIIKPEVNAKAAELLRQGITPTPGQIIGGTAQRIEERLQSVPLLGDAITHAKNKSVEEFNKVALNRALSPIGEKVSTIGREGVAEVKQKLSKAYDNLLPKISFVPDAQFQQEFANLRQLSTGLGEKEQSKFNSIIDDVMSKASPNGSMTGETFKIAESKLTNESKKFSGSGDAYQRELGDALNEALRIMRSSLPRTNPQYGKELQSINEGYANYARIRQAASSTNAGAREGIFTPAQLAQAVRSMDKSAGKGSSATGTALMQDLAEQGTNVLGSKVPDSGTAGRVMLGGGVGGLAGATGTLVPVAASLGVASLPYLGIGRKLAADVLTKRPEKAKELALLLRNSSPALSGAIPFALNQQ